MICTVSAAEVVRRVSLRAIRAPTMVSEMAGLVAISRRNESWGMTSTVPSWVDRAVRKVRWPVSNPSSPRNCPAV